MKRSGPWGWVGGHRTTSYATSVKRSGLCKASLAAAAAVYTPLPCWTCPSSGKEEEPSTGRPGGNTAVAAAGAGGWWGWRRPGRSTLDGPGCTGGAERSAPRGSMDHLLWSAGQRSIRASGCRAKLASRQWRVARSAKPPERASPQGQLPQPKDEATHRIHSHFRLRKHTRWRSDELNHHPAASRGRPGPAPPSARRCGRRSSPGPRAP